MLLAAFLSLGWWQLARGREKQALARVVRARPAIDVALDRGNGRHAAALPARNRARAITIRTRQILLDNMPSQAGMPGYRVLTPLVRAGTGDCCWSIAAGCRSDQAATSCRRWTFPPQRVPSPVDSIMLPEPGVRVGEAGVSGDTTWPRVLNFPRQADLEPRSALRSKRASCCWIPTLPDGYERAWRPALGFGPERHLGYAVQWFAFAVVLLVIFVALSLEHASPPDEKSEPS